MNKALNILKILSVAIVAFVIIFASYFFILLKGDETKILSNNAPKEQEIQRSLTETDRKLSQYLTELANVELDVDFYLSTTNPVSIAFDELVKKFKREIPTLEAGRKNPFEPLD